MSALAAVLGTHLSVGVGVLAGRNLNDPVDVSPGIWGFIATFALVIATVLLIIDMSRRVRRLRNRERYQQRQDEAARTSGDNSS